MTSVSFTAKAIKMQIRRALNRLGYDIVRFPAPNVARSALVDELVKRNISVVLDIGANTGQFAQSLRRSGYKNRIVSFEPISISFRQLKANAEPDPLWQAEKLALGSQAHRARINISRNYVSSSILELEGKTLKAEPSVEYIDYETIDVDRLDNVFNRLVSPVDQVFLKVDVQGYEKEVFRGASKSLPFIQGVISECSLLSLYKDEWLFDEVMAFFVSNEFFLTNLEKVFSDKKTNELLQIDATFWNSRSTFDFSRIASETRK